MGAMVVAALVPVAWLLGTFPSALLVARAHGRDVMHEGSGNPGASNVTRLLGWRAGALVLLLDFSKGALAAGAGMVIGGRAGACALGVAAVVGHTFPIYRKGGKGVATAGGALVVLYPLIVIGLVVVWFVVARLLHRASLASLLLTLLFPAAVAALGYDRWEVIVVSALALLVIVRHLGNIRRLLRRQEIGLDARKG
jgi:acyl phosphate:glycerol-3-phosphate acyltransferase